MRTRTWIGRGTAAWLATACALLVTGVGTPAAAQAPSPVAGAALSGEVLDAASGRVLFEGETGAPIGAGIVTYEAGGRQYIAVAGGSISPVWPLEEATSRITVYALP